MNPTDPAAARQAPGSAPGRQPDPDLASSRLPASGPGRDLPAEPGTDPAAARQDPGSAPGRLLDPAALRYDAHGLVPVVVQDVASGAVLMLAYADRRAVELTLATGQAHFWSRSRQALWRKGETSGNTLAVIEALADCDGDAVLLRVRPAGPACHRGTRSCFEPNAAALELGWLAAVAAGRRGADPARSYTARLLAAGVERVAQKVGEEAVETVVAALAAAARPERRGELVGESCDLLYHLLVLLLASGVPPGELAAELVRRHFGGTSAPGPAAAGAPAAPAAPAGERVR
jgi:phosphoribosyl-ATP pyrophosphohydrolase/phosphoribosyl-AMP cyclohydrolase